MENEPGLDVLLNFLSHVVEEKPTEPVIQEISIFEKETNIKKTSDNINENINFEKNNGDSSDDEESRNHNSKYNNYGKEIKTLLKQQNHTDVSSFSFKHDKQELSWNSKPTRAFLQNQVAKLSSSDVLYDPVFGIKISKPLISSTVLKERVSEKEIVPINCLQNYLQKSTSTAKDWVIGGVIVLKTDPKISQKGSQYSIWTLSDLKNDLKTVAIFLFKSAHKHLWKTSQGTVVAILNPNVLEKRRDGKDEASLSIDNPERVMILGQSKDLGYCKSRKKNGDICNAFINLKSCEFCIYHVRQEYNKFSKRSDLQGHSMNSSGLTALRNKVLGKNEVFYAGKLYTAIKPNKKLLKKDENRLQSLSERNNKHTITASLTADKKLNGNATSLDISNKQRMKDLMRLELLSGAKKNTSDLNTEKSSLNISIEEAREQAKEMLTKSKTTNNVSSKEVSTNKEISNSTMDLKTGSQKQELLNKDFKMPILNSNPPSEIINKIKNHVEDSSYFKPTLFKPQNDNNLIDFSLSSNSSNKKKEKKFDLSNQKQMTEVDIKNISKQKHLQNELNNSKLQNKQLKSLEFNETSSNHSSKKILNCKYASPSQIMTALKPPVDNSLIFSPVLTEPRNDFINLSTLSPKDYSRRLMTQTRLKALKYVTQNGPIEKHNPMNLKGTLSKKRILEKIDKDLESKRMKIEDNKQEKIKQIIEAKSLNADLINECDSDAQVEYLNKLEKKEQMEEKMMNTYKLKCKAVKCLQCKYTSFSASELCKANGHNLKVFDALKRFFKCGNCSYRTVTLDLFPVKACIKCNGSKWQKTSMIPEKVVQANDSLSIRGDEEKYIGSVVTGANINLLVSNE